MNLLNKLTITNLKLNKKRTIVTIIGIILSTALITGVATLVTSFRESIINYAKETSGNYHYKFEEVPYEELKYIKNNRNVDSYFITQNLGYSILEESKNEYKPYLYLLGFEQKAIENLNLELIEGRMPKKEGEVVIPYHLEANGGVKYKVGDKIKLNLGKRLVKEGEKISELNQNNPYNAEETFQTGQEKEYKIVGIIERPNYRFEAYSAPGYTIITYIENSEELQRPADIYTIYKDLGKQSETTAQILGIDKKVLEKRVLSMEDEKELGKAKYNFFMNGTLIKWQGLQFSDSTVTMLFSVAAVVIVIILVTSVYCIKNSFEISITERIKQYGMLASIGATSKQIRKNVLFEALILGIIGVPLGILSGLFAIFVLLQVIGNILSDALGSFSFIFATSIQAIIISIILCSITIYFSAKKSARRASKISPMEAIRGSEDIKIQKRRFFGKKKINLKTPKIINKIFGIGGDIAYKNLKRNKKKYRTTVISIVVSVATFIAMTTFFSYAFSSNDMYYVKTKYNVELYPKQIDEELESTIEEIISQKTVEKYAIIKEVSVWIKNEELEKHFSSQYKEIENQSSTIVEEEQNEYEGIYVMSLGNQEYRRYIKDLGLKYEECKNQAILIDNMRSYVWDTEKEDGNYVLYRIYDYKKGDKLDITISDDSPDKKISDGEKLELKIATVTDQRPMGLEGTYNDRGWLIVSDEWMQSHTQSRVTSIMIDAKEPQNLENYIDEHCAKQFHVNNYEKEVQQQNAMWLVIAIFLYGFITVISLIGVTNIFNTITTNMKLRSKEFANLKSIGMTKKEFNKMIRLESIFYCTKSLIFGILIGTGLSYLMYKAFAEGIEIGYLFPLQGIGISIIAVALLITVIMQYSLNKINKQNIIETIRKDNI